LVTAGILLFIVGAVVASDRRAQYFGLGVAAVAVILLIAGVNRL
jgi:hypothetical protein